MKVFGVVGWKNCGKTGLMERLVAEFCARGLSVSTLKHAHHAFDVDEKGRDSYRHREAGAREVLVSGGARWALMSELRGAEEPSIAELLGKLAPVDLVLVEGWKAAGIPKVSAYRAASGREVYMDAEVRAVASDVGLEVAVPVLDLDDTGAIADLIAAELGL